MDLILFTLDAIVVYLLSDWILRIIERRRGSALPHRQIVFFIIFFVLIMVTFHLIRQLGPG